MNAPICLCVADKLRLEPLLSHHDHGIILHVEEKSTLRKILSKAHITDRESELEDRVGLYDRVTLVSPSDPLDSFVLEITMPSEADLDADRISVAIPVSLAALGRARGTAISWEMPSGLVRQMTISSIVKAAEPAVA